MRPAPRCNDRATPGTRRATTQRPPRPTNPCQTPTMIFETIVTTLSPQAVPHIAPMGVRYDGDNVILMPFKPSTTLENILASRCAVLNLTTDTRVFAGCVTGRRDWPVIPANTIPCVRLAASLGHVELTLDDMRDDTTRPDLRLARGFGIHHGAS